MTENTTAKRSRSTRPARRWLWFVVVLVVAALIYIAMRPSPIVVDLAAVQRAPLMVTLDEEGQTRVRERYVISAPVSGEVLRIAIEPGDPVVAGETSLVSFQPAAPSFLDSRTRAEAAARVKAAESDVGLSRAERERIRAERDFADSELRRIGRLAESGIVSDELLDSARLAAATGKEALSAAEFAVATAEHRLELARATVRQQFGGASPTPITIRSPVAGVVLRRLRESAAVVSAGEPLIEVGDPRRLEIVSDFLSEDAVRIKSGADVLIDRWGGDGALDGRVRRVEPSGFTKISALGVEEQRVNVIIDFEDPSDAWAALGDGFRVETRVVVWRSDEVLQVPTSGLFRHDSGWAVFIAADDRARLTPVEIGWRNGLAAQILSGLTGDERIVVHPSDAIHDGVAIEPRER